MTLYDRRYSFKIKMISFRAVSFRSLSSRNLSVKRSLTEMQFSEKFTTVSVEFLHSGWENYFRTDSILCMASPLFRATIQQLKLYKLLL